MQTITEMRARLNDRAAHDEAFRARLVADPKSTVQSELDLRVPDGFSIVVHEENASTAHLVLPPSPRLEESDLAHAAGGFSTCPEGFRDFRASLSPARPRHAPGRGRYRPGGCARPPSLRG